MAIDLKERKQKKKTERITPRKKPEKLTEEELQIRKKKFALHYLETGKLRESAEKAGYAKNVATRMAKKFKEDPEVIAYMNEQMEKIANEKIADAQEICEFLTRTLRRQEKEYTVVTVKKDITRSEMFEGNRIRPVKERSEIPETVETPTKVSDALRAAELLGKRYSLWTDKIEVDAKNNEIKVELVD